MWLGPVFNIFKKLALGRISPTILDKEFETIHEIMQNRLLQTVLRLIFLQFFCRKTSTFGIWVDGWVLAIKSKPFGGFLEFS